MNDLRKAPNRSVSFIQFVKEGKNGARPKARCHNKWYGRVAREMRRWREGEGEGKHIKERREVGSSAITCYRKGIMISPVRAEAQMRLNAVPSANSGLYCTSSISSSRHVCDLDRHGSPECACAHESKYGENSECESAELHCSLLE